MSAGVVNVETHEPLNTDNDYLSKQSQYRGKRAIDFSPSDNSSLIALVVLGFIAVAYFGKGK